jgi:hypothetical protein
MTMKKVLRDRWFWLVMWVCGLHMLAGCSGRFNPKLVPVSGVVTLDGKPLMVTTTPDGKPLALDDNCGRNDYAVVFHPDAAKGNTNPWKCEGSTSCRLSSAGRYQLWTLAFVSPRAAHDTGTREGALLGWYKVTIRPTKGMVPEADIAKIRQYLDIDKTPLSIQVVENPESGHYDIKLESNNPR